MSDKDLKKLVTRLSTLFEAIYSLTNKAGELIYSDFQKLPPRTGTDYYKFITKPISLHTIGRNVKRLQYKTAQDFVDDLAQLTWNARHYNEPGSQIHEKAMVLDEFIHNTVIPKLVADSNVIDCASLHYPDLGPLDTFTITRMDSGYDQVSTRPQVLEQLEDDEDGTPNASAKPEQPAVRRGRPPIIDKPYEARIKSILKYMKRVPHPDDPTYNLTHLFERLPEKSNTQYYEIILKPISLHEIRAKVRSRKYTDVRQFLADLNQMTSNNKQYHALDSDLLHDVMLFDSQLQAIISREMLRPESDFIIVPNSGADKPKIPLDAVTVKNHIYKVGDWVLIKNPNDSLKPIIGQIFRLWSTDGVQYANVCWYIRPEQTCHRVDRLFYKNEVCKTSEYSDHRADDIIAPCYVIFLTHFQKGDIPPSLLPKDSEWFICEFRYNSSSYAFNRIRTWKACLPDEIRHIDQPILPLSEPRKLIKYDSPIKHMLKSDAIDMSRVAPTEGIDENGPPVVGAVYLKPPFYNDDLGQSSTSPHVHAAPEYDDRETGRRAYIFTPLSQLKMIAGSSNYSTTGARPLSGSYGQNEESGYELYKNYSQLGGTSHGGYSSIKPYGKTENSPSLRDSTPSNVNNVQTITSAYSAVFTGGIVSYIESHPEDAMVETVDKISELLITSAGKTVWFRAPPTIVGEKLVAPVSHSAKYMAWKLKKAAKS